MRQKSTEMMVLAKWLQAERYTEHPETGCWMSHASLSGGPGGYPCVHIGGRNGRTRLLGHLVLERTLGRALKPGYDEVMRHTCAASFPKGDVSYRRCVRPEHLTVGTQKQNVQDGLQAQRQLIGERNGSAKFTEQDIRSMRYLYSSGLFSQSALARIWGTDHGGISRIINRKTWAHVV